MRNNNYFTVYNLEEIFESGGLDAVKQSFLEALYPHKSPFISNYPDSIEEKNNFRYFFTYLYADPKGLNIKSIVVEENYTSIPYLKDYLSYYGKAYKEYSKSCKRVHFFKTKISNEDEFYNIIIRKNDETLKPFWNSYRGYIVIRPLPRGYVGNTLLATYSEKEGRYYTVVRDYFINLFGKKLQLSSLLYQEQDGIISNCATSSIRFAIEKLNELFHTPLLAPSEITLAAGDNINSTGKNFPSPGLEISQVCKALSNSGLICELRAEQKNLKDEKWLKAFVYAYLKMGIPILFGLNMENNPERDLHMVTLCGYRFKEGLETKSEKYKIDLVSDKISRFYSHDDQTGCFSRLVFNSSNGNKRKKSKQFTTSIWKKEINKYSDVQLTADSYSLIVPLKNNISVVFEDILEEVTILNFFLNDFFLQHKINIVWDIYLCKSNDYKDIIYEEISNQNELLTRDSVLFQSLPQIIWVSKAYCKTENNDLFVLFDLIYDAIDVNYEFCPFSANIYNDSFKQLLVENFKNVDNEPEETEYSLFETLGFFGTSKSENIVGRFYKNSTKAENSRLTPKERLEFIKPSTRYSPFSMGEILKNKKPK